MNTPWSQTLDANETAAHVALWPKQRQMPRHGEKSGDTSPLAIFSKKNSPAKTVEKI